MTANEKPKAPHDATVHPCGCTVITYETGEVEADLCIPCAIGNAGQMLQHVARKLAQKNAVDGEGMIGGTD